MQAILERQIGSVRGSGPRMAVPQGFWRSSLVFQGDSEDPALIRPVYDILMHEPVQVASLVGKSGALFKRLD